MYSSLTCCSFVLACCSALRPEGKRKRGRKRLLDAEGVKLLQQRATDKSVSQDSFKGREAGCELFEEVQRELAPNSIAHPKSCRTTRFKYLQEAGIITTKRGEVKNKARQAAYLNIRTSISMAAMMRCLYRKCHTRLMNSSDDFTVVLNSFDDTISLLTTKTAKKILKEINLGIATTQNSNKRRVVVMNCTISYYGVVCKVVRFSDRNFTEFRKLPKIFDMNDNFFVILHHPDIPDRIVTEFLYLKCIIPSALERREKIIRAAIEPLREVICSQSSAASSAAVSEIEEELNLTRSAVQALQLDMNSGEGGEYGQTELEEEEEEEKNEEEEEEEEDEDDKGEEEEGNVDEEKKQHEQRSRIAADHVLRGDVPGARAYLQQFAAAVPNPEFSAPDEAVGPPPNNTSVPSTSVPPMNSPEEEAARLRFAYIVLLCDGAIPQVQALLGRVNDKCIEKGLRVVMAKTPGGASLTTAVNDAGDMHKGSHSQFSSALQGYREYPEPDERCWLELKALLERYLEGDSFRTLWKCIRAAPHILADTFKPSTIQKAFHTAGTLVVRSTDRALVPDDVTMLSHCPAFGKLNDRKAAFVLSTIPKFAAIFAQNGFVSEDEFTRILGGESEGVDNCPSKTGMPLELMSTSRQRAVIMNSDGWLQHMKFVADYKEELNYKKLLREEERENKKQRRELDEATSSNVKVAKVEKVRGHGTLCVASPQCTRFKGDNGRTDKQACKGWTKCPHSFCRVWACPNHECKEMLEIHSEYECGRAPK